MAFEPFIGDGLLQIGWITLLGPDLCRALGDRPTAEAFAADRVGVVDLGMERGVMLLADQAPVLASNQPSDAPELRPYQAIGSRISTLALPDDQLEFLDIPGLRDEQQVRRWYRRFLTD